MIKYSHIILSLKSEQAMQIILDFQMNLGNFLFKICRLSRPEKC